MSTSTGWHDERLPGLGFLGIVVFVFSTKWRRKPKKESWALLCLQITETNQTIKSRLLFFQIRCYKHLTFCCALCLPSTSANECPFCCFNHIYFIVLIAAYISSKALPGVIVSLLKQGRDRFWIYKPWLWIIKVVKLVFLFNRKLTISRVIFPH